MEKIDPRKLLGIIAKLLNDLQISYIITGGIAVLVWGRPRFTADIDIVVELKEKDVDNLEKALRGLSDFGYIDRSMMERALKNKGEFNFIDGETGVKVDFWVSKDNELSHLQFQRKVEKDINGQKVYFISPEDLILSKLDWYKKSESTRQLEDVESVFKISGKILDKNYLNFWAKKLGFSETLDKLINFQ